MPKLTLSTDTKLLLLERIACALLIGWLQLVGFLTHSVLHHILHSAPLVLLLIVPPSAARHFTGFLAGYLWVFMLAAVTPMVYESLILGYLFKLSKPYLWLAPVAALLAAIWSAANLALLRGFRWFGTGTLIGFSLIGLLAWAHPYLSAAIEYPLERTLAGDYPWILILLMETAVVLALPGWSALRLCPQLRVTWAFIGWQVSYWVVFVTAMVVGLLPGIVRDP